MKRIRIVGACLVAVFAFSAVVVSAASASSFAPEFAKCVTSAKTAKGSTHKYEGHFNNKACSEPGTEAEGHGKYELASAVGTEFTGKSKKTVLHVVGANGKAEVITCKKDTIKGIVAASNRVSVTITFEGCTNEKKESCGTAGKIESSSGHPIFLEYLNEAETEYGAYSPSPMSSFSCGSESFELEGGLVGTATANGKDVTIAYAVNGSGEQAKRLFYSAGELEPVGSLYTEHEGEHEATVEGMEELKLKSVYIV